MSYFDHENRLVHINASTEFWFRFDALGRRVEENEDGTVTLFYYDGVHIVEETDSTQTLTRLSLFGIGIDEVLYSGALDGGGDLQNHRWPMTDHLGSVHLVVDDDGDTTTIFNYTTAYGQASIGGDYPYGLTGRRLVGSGGDLYDYRSRFYRVDLGRFLSRDPIGLWEDSRSVGNGYRYVGNDPTNKIDPTGLWKLAAFAGARRTHEVMEGSWFTHEEMTRLSYEYALPGTPFASDRDCGSRILSELRRNSSIQDTQFFFEHERHYTRPIRDGTGAFGPGVLALFGGSQKALWDFSYDWYITAEEITLRGLYAKVTGGVDWNNSDCNQALRSLGLLLHSWQDYFAHVMCKDGSKFCFRDGHINCNPENRCFPMFYPASWTLFGGEHGRYEINQLPALQQEAYIRMVLALKFGTEKLRELLWGVQFLCCD